MVTRMELSDPLFGLPSVEAYPAFRDYPALYRLLAKGTHRVPSMRFQSAEELGDQLKGVQRQVVGGAPGVPVGSTLFVPGILTTTGKLGLRGEAVLDEQDTAIDFLRYGDQALRAGSSASALRISAWSARLINTSSGVGVSLGTSSARSGSPLRADMAPSKEITLAVRCRTESQR